MSGGRPAKPTALKVLHGTERKDRRNTGEPRPADGRAKPPAWLSAEGKRVWRKLAPAVEQMGCLTVADSDAFALLCDVYVEYQAAKAIIADEGATYVTYTQSGSTMHRQRPEVAMAADAWRRLQRMMSEFGMTPSARGRVNVPTPEKQADPFEEWTRGNRAG